MIESAASRAKKYLETTSASLKQLKVRQLPATVEQPRLNYVLEMVQGYIKDATHYAEKRKHITSLACVSYAEGLLDAMKFLELLEF